MIDDRIIYPRAKVANLETDTERAGLRIAWNFIRSKISSSKFASIVFQDQDVLDGRGIGGFFTSIKYVNILYLSKDYLRDGKIRFKDDESAAVFLHECSHYLHLVSNHGRFSQKDDAIASALPPVSRKADPKIRYYVEREAWSISLNLDRVFRLGLIEEINRINSHNMLIVERSLGMRNFKVEEIKKLEKSLTIDQFHWKD